MGNSASRLTSFISSKSSSNGPPVFVAIYNYESRSLQELSFNAQDTFIILDRSDVNWWKVYCRETQREGYVPRAYITESESLMARPWYFGDCKRREAESALALKHVPHFSFIVRVSESTKGGHSLSVKYNTTVKHFRILRKKNGQWWISKTKSFNDMDSMVKWYRTNLIGSTDIKLVKPCPRVCAPMTIGLSFSTIDHWEIERSTIQLNNRIGQGQFGEVWEGTWNRKHRVAVKTLKPGTMRPEEFLEEAQVMKKLCHQHLIQLLAVCTMKEPIYIITEYMPNGSLLHYLQKTRGTKNQLEFHVQVSMAAQVASGMAFIEMNNYVHRDLAARNVLVGENNVVKVADFGLTRLIDDGLYAAKGTMIPIKWSAPEACTYRTFTIKSDVWSYGILLYELVTHGESPYPGWDNRTTLEKVHQGYRMPKPKGCEEYLYDIMLETWNKSPQDRPTFETLQWKLDEAFTLEGSEYLKAADALKYDDDDDDVQKNNSHYDDIQMPNKDYEVPLLAPLIEL